MWRFAQPIFEAANIRNNILPRAPIPVLLVYDSGRRSRYLAGIRLALFMDLPLRVRNDFVALVAIDNFQMMYIGPAVDIVVDSGFLFFLSTLR